MDLLSKSSSLKTKMPSVTFSCNGQIPPFFRSVLQSLTREEPATEATKRLKEMFVATYVALLSFSVQLCNLCRNLVVRQFAQNVAFSKST